MELTIQNIGKIKSTITPIKFNGITLICGKNDTGKSTVSKILFSIFDSLYDIDSKVKYKKRKAIKCSIDNQVDIKINFTNNAPILNDLLSCEDDSVKKILIDYFDSINYKFEKDDINKIENEIKKIKKYDDKDVVEEIIDEEVGNEFSYQVNSLLNEEKGSILLKLKNKYISFEYQNNHLINYLKDEIDIKKVIYYFEGPHLLNKFVKFTFNQGDYIHNEKFKDMIGRGDNNKKILEDIIKEDSEDTYKNLKGLKISINKFTGEGYVNKEGWKNPLNVSSLSNGLKTMALLANLFDSGFLAEKNLLILDEPEISLHPEWQIDLARMLVKLQKKYELTILINTHSPFFLNAIDTYSYYYGTNDNCSYYLAENEEENPLQSNIREVSDIDEVYEMLSAPFDEIDEIRGKILYDRK